MSVYEICWIISPVTFIFNIELEFFQPYLSLTQFNTQDNTSCIFKASLLASICFGNKFQSFTIHMYTLANYNSGDWWEFNTQSERIVHILNSIHFKNGISILSEQKSLFVLQKITWVRGIEGKSFQISVLYRKQSYSSLNEISPIPSSLAMTPLGLFDRGVISKDFGSWITLSL